MQVTQEKQETGYCDPTIKALYDETTSQDE